jgi:Protein of unknown function (DUF3108)
VHWSLTRISRYAPVSRRCWISGGTRRAITAAAACILCAHANAQGKLDARYVATLAGVQIGTGGWVIDIGDDQFSAAANGMTTGLLRVFTTGEGISTSRGTVRGDNLTPTLFVSTINNDKRVEELKLVMSAGNVKDMVVEPPTMPHPDRVPLTDAHRRGIVDPMSAALIRVAGNDDPVGPEACRRTLPVFDGRMRFDLQLSFNRFEKVQAEKGYQGPVAVCRVRFVPVAGHVPDRPAIKYLAAQQDIEMWLAPIAGTRIVVPYKISIPTPIGRGVLEATQFVTTASPHPGPATAAVR